MTKRKPNPRAERKGGCMLKTVQVRRGIKPKPNNNFAVFSASTELVLTTMLCAWWECRTMAGFED